MYLELCGQCTVDNPKKTTIDVQKLKNTFCKTFKVHMYNTAEIFNLGIDE